MKKWNCDSCGTEIKVLDDYEPEFCCEGRECGCYGGPINPIFCDDCERIIWGKPVENPMDEKEIHADFIERAERKEIF